MSRASEYLERYEAAKKIQPQVDHEGEFGYVAALHGDGLYCIGQEAGPEGTVIMDKAGMKTLTDWFWKTIKEA
jgi:hypothetical protein